MNPIPVIDIGPLFGEASVARAIVDCAIADAANSIGFMTTMGHSTGLAVSPKERALMLKLFELPQEQQRPLWKRNFAPENKNLYRGWFPLESSKARTREGFEFGPDIVRTLPENFGLAHLRKPRGRYVDPISPEPIAQVTNG